MSKMEVWANLPVEDVEKTRQFFRQLGFKDNGPNDSEDLASFIFSEAHFAIHFFRKDRFKVSAGNAVSNTSVGSEILFTIAADSKADVDQWREKIVRLGGEIYDEPKDIIPYGYGLGFIDLDGHRWNVFFFNPS
ncbi:VOC family protein [Dyadobacter subterraneus]|uniref:Glyoxalase n=1 Tax=Dyadobacter subterraneus TaxID=2773304 RepID=A0ABR9W7E3_9BACT|nr:VOC family protein [Dyadobacter subterraneus]MBE9461382.1 glyoxalase [Dyadobacter subterraneus]